MAEEIQAVGDTIMTDMTEDAPIEEASAVVEAAPVAETAIEAEAVPEAETTVETEAVESAAVEAPPVEAPPVRAAPVADFQQFEAVITPPREVDGYAYEIMYIVEPGCDLEQIKEVAERARQIIETGDGALDNVRTSQVRRLAYEIKDRRDGIYVVLNLRSQPAVTRELDRMFKLQERVLRHMILRTDK